MGANTKKMSKKEVLKKLGISSFSQLKKADLVKMESMLDKMDPEVAKEVLEQFPEFADCMKEILKEYRATLDQTISSNEKSLDSFYISCDAIISSLQAELNKELLTFEDKKYIIEKMVEVSKMKSDKDSENKRFLAAIVGMGAVAVAAIGGAIVTVLGNNVSVGTNDTNVQ